MKKLKNLKLWILKKLTKIGSYINKFRHRLSLVVVLVKHRFNHLKTMHERIKELDMQTLKDTEPSNPYQMLQSWLIDNITFGVLSTIAINGIFGWQGWYNVGLILGLSALRPVTKDFVNLISKSIRDK